MKPKHGKNTKPARPRWPTFSFEWLEDRCVFSATPLDLVSGTRTVLSVPDSVQGGLFSQASTVNYTGTFLTVPTSQVEGRTATFVFDDSQVLPGAFVFTNAGTTGIVATHTFDVPDSSRVELRLTSTEVSQDSLNYQIRVDTVFAPTTGGLAVVLETTAISFSQNTAASGAVPPVPVVPPAPAIIPPTQPPTRPPNANDGPVGPNNRPDAAPPVEEKPPAVPRSAPRVTVLPPVEQAQFEAATTQTAFVYRQLPAAELSVARVMPTRSDFASTVFVPIVSPRIPELPTRRESSVVNPPAVLELAAARESKPQRSEATELPELLGTAIEPQEPVKFSDETYAVLSRMSQPLSATSVSLADHGAIPVEKSDPEPKSNRASYLLLATLIGVGSGHFFHGRREAKTGTHLAEHDRLRT